MSEPINPEVNVDTELDLLKAKADELGIQYHPAIGLAKLQIKIDESVKAVPAASPKPVKKAAPAKSKRQLMNEYHTRLRKEANQLVRVRITCMNPNKKNQSGEIMSVSNSVIGTVRKFIQFNAEDGYHIPRVLYTLIKNRKFQHFVVKKTPGKPDMQESKILPEFAIELMEPLTPTEYKELGQRQALNHSV